MTQFFQDFANLGAGWVLVLLIVLSVISIGVMVDRFMWFSNRDTDTDRFTRELRGAFERGEVERLIQKHANDPAVPVRVAMRGVAERDHGPDAVAEAMHGERSRWRRAGDQNLIILGTLGNNVPFVGLFGTVLGVIKAFAQLEKETSTTQAAVVDELAKALTATAVGLIVAIPAVVAFNYFSRRLKVIMTGADECAHAVLAMVHAREFAARSATGPVPAPMPETVVTKDKADGGT